MFKIQKYIRLEAAHHLPQMPPEHKCRRPHGHSYKIEASVGAQSTNETSGFIMDFSILGDFLKLVHRICDHRDLNDIYDFYTTAENLAREWCNDLERFLRIDHKEVYQNLKYIEIKVWETEQCSATFTRSL